MLYSLYLTAYYLELEEFSIEKLSSVTGLSPEALFVGFLVCQLDPDPANRSSAQKLLNQPFLCDSYRELQESNQQFTHRS